MAEFAKYYLEYLWQLLQNIGHFFGTIFYAFSKAFGYDIKNYFISLGDASKDFDIFGWTALIFVSIVNLVLVFFLLYRLFQVIRRYIIFRAKEVEKDELLEEIAKLKEQSDLLIQEKSQILSMKLGAVSPYKNGMITDAKQPDEISSAVDVSCDVVGRFTKLKTIDTRYIQNPHFVNMTNNDMISLKAICEHFVNYAASHLNLYYDIKTIQIMLAGMATSKIIIIEGISGTGKTSLPYALSRFFSNNASIVSVQPSWRDRAELIGYLNEFTKKFNETDFLAALYEATYRQDLSFIVLDEMNLARIEYYFAEFLSIMEMPDITEWKIDLVPSPQFGDPTNLNYGKLIVPQNVWFVGTANQDDSTFTITDKVYDRAVSIYLNTKGKFFDAPVTENISISYDYLDSLYNKALNTIKLSPEIMKKLNLLDDFILSKFKISFGNRILRQIKTFIPVFVACGGDEIQGLDYMVMTKVLRKFTSLNLVFLSKELSELIMFLEKNFGRNSFSYSIEYIKQLQKNI